VGYLQSSERGDESRHEREGVQDVASVGDALLVDNLKVGIVVSVPAAVLEKAISKLGIKTRDCAKTY
jgi:hypothetical protein